LPQGFFITPTHSFFLTPMKSMFVKLIAAAALVSLSPSAMADSGFITGLGGGVGFGYGNNRGNGGFIDAEFGYEWSQPDGPDTALVLALDYSEVEYRYLGARDRVLQGRDDLFALAPRVRVTFPIDEFVSFYAQGQVGVNFSDGAINDLGWGAGAGFTLGWTSWLETRLGYLVIADTQGNGFHGALAAFSVRF
jgi:hypothetical protein